MNTTKKAKKTRLAGENRTERQKASDAKRAEKIKATLTSRKNSDAITRELKIDWSKLSSRKRRLIARAGHECNWLYLPRKPKAEVLGSSPTQEEMK